MLSLTVRSGEYVTIGPDIVVQVVRAGEITRLAIDAPRELSIERAEVRERREAAPDCIQRVRKSSTPPQNRYKRAQKRV